MGQKRAKDSSSFFDDIKRYVDLKIEYYQLLLSEKISLLVGRIFLLILFLILALALLLMIIVLIYNLLMTWIGVAWIVALIEIGFLILVMGLIWLFRNQMIINPVANSIIRMLLDSDPNEEEEDK